MHLPMNYITVYITNYTISVALRSHQAITIITSTLFFSNRVHSNRNFFVTHKLKFRSSYAHDDRTVVYTLSHHYEMYDPTLLFVSHFDNCFVRIVRSLRYVERHRSNLVDGRDATGVKLSRIGVEWRMRGAWLPHRPRLDATPAKIKSRRFAVICKRHRVVCAESGNITR